MFKSYWIVAVALGLAIVTSGQAQEQTESPQGEASQQDQPPYEPPLPFPIEIVEDDAHAGARERSEEEARQREISDLAAQEGMNSATQAIKDATLDMRDYAQASTWLVAIGTIFLFATIWLTWRAVRDTRDIGQKQVRAYVCLKDCRIDGIVEGQKATAFLNFVNSGQSPCYITASSIGIGFEPTPIKTIPPLAPEKKFTPSSSGAGGEFSHTISIKRELNSEDVAAYTSGEMGFIIACAITYKDVFGHEHETIETVYCTVHKPAHANGLSVLSIGNKHT